MPEATTDWEVVMRIKSIVGCFRAFSGDYEFHCEISDSVYIDVRNFETGERVYFVCSKGYYAKLCRKYGRSL